MRVGHEVTSPTQNAIVQKFFKELQVFLNWKWTMIRLFSQASAFVSLFSWVLESTRN